MIISAIVAVGHNNVIGSNNKIPWYLPADLKYFKKKTINHTLLMGRKTFQSIGRPLPKRTNIVITRDPFFTASGVLVVHSIEEGLELANQKGAQELFIIGGGQIYKESIPYWDKIYLTEVDIDIEGEVYFPDVDLSDWELLSSESHPPNEKNEYGYTFKVFKNKSV